MLIDITQHVKKPINGIIQIGAHHGNEYQTLKKLSPNILMFEPQKSAYKILKEQIMDSSVIIENIALGSAKQKTTMYLEKNNQGQSSSILLPQLHLIQYPSIQFVDVEEIDMTTLNEYFENKDFNYNLFTIDVQGYELEVLKGCTKYLNKVDYILCEVNRAELYKGCPMVEEIDLFLNDYGLKRKVTSWDGYTWGDALYCRE